MRRYLLLLFLAAGSAEASELQAVVASALSRSPAVAESRARAQEARAAGNEAFYARFPRLSARASAARGDDPLFAFGALLQQRRVTQVDFAPDTLNRPGYRTLVHGALELGMPIFTGFELSRAGELARLGTSEAEASAGAAAQAVRLRTTDGYIRGLKDRELLAELGSRISSAEKAVESAERLKKQGLVLGSDHQAALAILSGLKAWRSRAAAEKAAHAQSMLDYPKADDSAMQARLKMRKEQAGVTYRDDIKGFVDVIDVDEKRL